MNLSLSHARLGPRNLLAAPSLLLGLVAFGLSLSTNAQAIVNTQPLFKDVTQDSPYGLLARAGTDLQRGNTQLLVLSASLAARAQWEDHELLLTGAHDRSTANSEQIGNKSFIHQRYRYWLAPAVQWEVFTQVAQDKFRLIQLRILGGTGPRFVPIKSKTFEWTIGLAYFYERERVVGSVDFPDGLTRKTHRANIYSRAKLDIATLTLVQLIYAQPSWADPSNVRILHQIDSAVEITEHFSLTWTVSQTRDSIAPSDVKPLDVHLIGGVKADF